MSRTVQQILTIASSSSDFAVAVASLQESNATSQTEPGFGFGETLLSLLVPTLKVRTGLTSGATHVEERPGFILGVLDAAGAAQRAIILVGVPGAGQVLVTYDAAGIPTLLFGDGANTGYRVLKIEAPEGVATKLAAQFR